MSTFRGKDHAIPQNSTYYVNTKVIIVNNAVTEENAIGEIDRLNTYYYNGSNITFMLDPGEIEHIDNPNFDIIDENDLTFTCKSV